MPPREATPAHHPRGNAARRYPHGAATAFPPRRLTRRAGRAGIIIEPMTARVWGGAGCPCARRRNSWGCSGPSPAAIRPRSRRYAATRAKLYGVVLRILRRADLADEVMQEAY